MSRKILIDRGLYETRIAATLDEKLTDLIIEPNDRKSLFGNIYLGRISRFSDAMDAAFIEYGGETSGLLLGRDTQTTSSVDKATQIRQKRNEGEKFPVQVIKDPTGDKPAQLSSFIEFESQNLVYKPFAKDIVFSKKLKDKSSKQELQDTLGPFEGGLTVRSSALNKSTDHLIQEFDDLQKQWQEVSSNASEGKTPRLLQATPPTALKLFNRYHDEAPEVIINDVAHYQKLNSALNSRGIPTVSCTLWTKPDLLFDYFQVEAQIEEAHQIRLQLPSGGNITIEETEALVVVDVNSGSAGKPIGLRTPAFRTNEEAASLLAEHLILRNLSGIVIVDFIQMSNKEDNREIENLLRKVTRNDPSQVRVIGMTELGLMQLTRQRKLPSISMSAKNMMNCGVASIPISVASDLLRNLQRFAAEAKTRQIGVKASKKLSPLLLDQQQAIETSLSLSLSWKEEPSLEGLNYTLNDGRT